MPSIRILAAGGTVAAIAVVTAAGVPAIAAHDDNPSTKVASYRYALNAVQPDDVPNSQATGTTRIKSLPNGKVQVKVEASGLAPGLPHAMHLHGVQGDETDRDAPARRKPVGTASSPWWTGSRSTARFSPR